MHSKPLSIIKKDTKEAIEKLLVEHDYRTNIMELRTSELKRKTIMIIVGDLDRAEVDKLGRKAIDLLVSNIEGKTTDGGSVVYKPKIIERNSVKSLNMGCDFLESQPICFLFGVKIVKF